MADPVRPRQPLKTGDPRNPVIGAQPTQAPRHDPRAPLQDQEDPRTPRPQTRAEDDPLRDVRPETTTESLHAERDSVTETEEEEKRKKDDRPKHKYRVLTMNAVIGEKHYGVDVTGDDCIVELHEDDARNLQDHDVRLSKIKDDDEDKRKEKDDEDAAEVHAP